MNSEEHFRELLPLYLDEACTSEEKVSVENHLSTCAGCRKELEELKTTVRLVKELKPIDAPIDVIRQVENKIKKGSLFKLWGLQPLSAALAVTIILLLGVTLHKYSLVYKYYQNDPQISTTVPVPSIDKKAIVSEAPETAVSRKEDSNVTAVATNVVPQDKDRLRGRAQTVAVKNKKKKVVKAEDPSSYLVEMEVDNMENGLQALRNLAENYRVQSKEGSGGTNDVFLEIQGQNFGEFMKDLHTIGKVSYGLSSEEEMETSTAPAHSSASRLIRIKFNENR